MGLEGPKSGMELGGTMRKTYETDDLIEYSGTGTRRLRPPPSLGVRERAVFVDLVTGCDPRHFRPADLPLMARYCEAIVLAEEAAGELAAGRAVIDGKVSPWFGIHQAACKTVAVLTLRLRLGPQSRQPRAHKTTTGPTSYYEIMELEAQRDGAKPD
jgi:hypothetical protein